MLDGRDGWQLKSHLVDPVVTAAIQNRLGSAHALDVLRALVTACPPMVRARVPASALTLQDTSALRYLQQLFAHDQLLQSAAVDSSSRLSLVRLIDALCRSSIVALKHANAPAQLLDLYGGKMDDADTIILGTLRFAEHEAGQSIRSAVGAWTPFGRRGERGETALVGLDAASMYGACVVATGGSATDAYEPSFVLGLLALYLERPSIGYTDWLALCRCGVLGLPVCALASASDPSLRIAADRVLGRLSNRLQEATERVVELDEIGLVLDHVRSLADAPLLPATLALFARALHAVADADSFAYALASNFLLQRPSLEASDPPLLYAILYTREPTAVAAQHRRWLITLLGDGAVTAADWAMWRRRKVWDLLASVLQSGLADDDERALIFEVRYAEGTG